ncbi:MAG: L,D-transpeptidase family protein [Acidobacteria bacterium]|nr:L,D-transpeptidase family protein [Acidobacteriota bacterium]
MVMFRNAVAALFGAVAIAASGAGVHAGASPLLAGARQLILVVTPGWDDVQGQLRRFEREGPGQPWRPVGQAGTIVVGRNGTAWDPLASPVVPGPRKAEGDGRSPAGVFALGRAFGFAPAADAAWLKLPYLPVVEGIECVDDPASTVYNQIVDRRRVQSPDWKSSERMRDVGEAYRWGVVVHYNTPAVAKRGSCIFLHIGGEGGRGTAGCTAMPATDLRAVMEWLDPGRAPVLVQLPAAAYEKLKGEWVLP